MAPTMNDKPVEYFKLSETIQHPTRRLLLRMSVGSVLTCFMNCCANQGRDSAYQGYWIENGTYFADEFLFCVSNRPDAQDPLAANLNRWFSSTGRSRLMLMYSGQVIVSKEIEPYRYDYTQQKQGSLATRVTYSRSKSSISTTESHYLNGEAVGPNRFRLQFQPNLFGVPVNKQWRSNIPVAAFVWVSNGYFGIGLPLIRFNKTHTAPSGPYVKKTVWKLSPVGVRFVPVLGRECRVWKYSSKKTSKGARSVSMSWTYESLLSDEVPGRLLEYRYHRYLGDALAESSIGTLTAIQ